MSSGKCFGYDRLDTIFPERTNQCVRNRNFPKSINGCNLTHNTAASEHGEAPGLLAEFNELRICDSAPSLDELTIFPPAKLVRFGSAARLVSYGLTSARIGSGGGYRGFVGR
jgi:hypothetical protein